MGPNHALELTLPARAASVPRARTAIADYARLAGLPPERIDDLRLVVSEAVTNVVLHAYGDEGGQVHLTAAPAGGDLWVLVEDHGLGLRTGAESPGLGLGLGLIERLADEFALERSAEGGTLLRIGFALCVAARGRSEPVSELSNPVVGAPRAVVAALEGARTAQLRG